MSRKGKWLAVLVGAALVVGAALWFASWTGRQGEAEVAHFARAAIKSADRDIDEAVAVLNQLANRSVDSCQPAHQAMLRQTVLASAIVKELALVAAGGRMLCTDAGSAAQDRDIIASADTSDPAIKLDVVAIGERNDRLLQVRRVGPAGKPSLAALLPAALLLPQAGPQGARFDGFARLSLSDGTLVGTLGSEKLQSTTQEDGLVRSMVSARYGIVVTVAFLRESVFGDRPELQNVALLILPLGAIAALTIAFVLGWRRRNNPISEIERAIFANEFVPYYQPIVDIKAARVLGAEVLVRWRKPDGTIIPPGAFIGLVESKGLIVDLTRSLMRQVCNDIGPAISCRPRMYISFNVAPLHFNDSVVLNDVGSIFEGSPLRLSQIVLELTERCEIGDMHATRRVIAGLQALGCRIAIDDVGTGQSGLSYIHKLGADIIKIDKAFVESIQTEHKAQAIVNSLVDLARNLRMQIVAEGVEKFEQVSYLREHGISAVQGYVFAPPLPLSAFLELVESISPDMPVAAKPADDSKPDEVAALDQVAAA